MGNAETILYGFDECNESKAMANLLDELGVQYELRVVNRDPRARREWEQLDGDQTPMLRMGNHSFVRGFDRIKVQQLFGWVGC